MIVTRATSAGAALAAVSAGSTPATTKLLSFASSPSSGGSLTLNSLTALREASQDIISPSGQLNIGFTKSSALDGLIGGLVGSVVSWITSSTSIFYTPSSSSGRNSRASTNYTAGSEIKTGNGQTVGFPVWDEKMPAGEYAAALRSYKVAVAGSQLGPALMKSLPKINFGDLAKSMGDIQSFARNLKASLGQISEVMTAGYATELNTLLSASEIGVLKTLSSLSSSLEANMASLTGEQGKRNIAVALQKTQQELKALGVELPPTVAGEQTPQQLIAQALQNSDKAHKELANPERNPQTVASEAASPQAKAAKSTFAFTPMGLTPKKDGDEQNSLNCAGFNNASGMFIGNTLWASVQSLGANPVAGLGSALTLSTSANATTNPSTNAPTLSLKA